MEDNKERTLYCGNISEKVTEDLLYELFLQAGPLENVSIPKEKDGRQRNYGFVTFKHAISVPYSVALMNGISLFGRPLRLDARTGAESEPNAYLEKLRQYRSSFAQPGYNLNDSRGYDKRSSIDDRSRRYIPRREPERVQLNMIPQVGAVTPVLYPGYNNPYFSQQSSLNPVYGITYPGRYDRNQNTWSGNRR